MIRKIKQIITISCDVIKKKSGLRKRGSLIKRSTVIMPEEYCNGVSSIQFSHSVMSDFLQPHGLQQARPPCPSPTPGAYSTSCLLSPWCQPTISSSVFILLSPSLFPSIRVFSNESVLHIKWPKYWSLSFSISPSSEYSGLISFRID